MRGFGVEVLAQCLGAAELLVLEQDPGADVAKRAGQLIVVGVATRQTIVVDEDLQLSLAQRRVVEVRQIVDRGAGGVHRRLINQVDFAEKLRVADDRERQCRQPAKKRHPGRAMPVEQREHLALEAGDRIRHRLNLPFHQGKTAACAHYITSQNSCQARRNRPYAAAAAQPMGWIIRELSKNLIKREVSACGNPARLPTGRRMA